jgi:hypothetical protein
MAAAFLIVEICAKNSADSSGLRSNVSA